MFRDENARIARRATQKHGSQPSSTAKAQLEPDSKTWSGDDSSMRLGKLQHRPQSTLLVSSPIVLSTHFGSNEGACYFYQEFSWETVPLYSASFSERSPALCNATAALGLAMLSFKRSSLSLSRDAHAEYGTALQLVNRELSNPVAACSDSTLAVVVLMSFFEVCLNSTQCPIMFIHWKLNITIHT